jgi:cob(I)alamin adenosyltransferase
MVQDFSGTVRNSPEFMAIHTALYDLIAAFSTEDRPDEEDVVTATIVHLLQETRDQVMHVRQRLASFPPHATPRAA